MEYLQGTFTDDNSCWVKAEAILKLIKESHLAGIILLMMKHLCSEDDMMKTSASAIAQIIEESGALVAMIAVAIVDGEKFAQKIKTYCKHYN